MLKRSKILILIILGGILGYTVGHGTALGQYVTSKLTPPPPVPDRTSPTPPARNVNAADSFDLQYRVRPTIPSGYEDIDGQAEYAADLRMPSNITTEAEYDYETGCYVIHTRLGDNDIVTPFVLSANEYNNMVLRQSMMEYYRQKNAESLEEKEKNPFNFLDMQFGLGPLESVFGPGGVQLKTSGSVTINMGVKSNKTDNPALSVAARRKTYFDFDQKIQATIQASVGDIRAYPAPRAGRSAGYVLPSDCMQ